MTHVKFLFSNFVKCSSVSAHHPPEIERHPVKLWTKHKSTIRSTKRLWQLQPQEKNHRESLEYRWSTPTKNAVQNNGVRVLAHTHCRGLQTVNTQTLTLGLNHSFNSENRRRIQFSSRSIGQIGRTPLITIGYIDSWRWKQKMASNKCCIKFKPWTRRSFQISITKIRYMIGHTHTADCHTLLAAIFVRWRSVFCRWRPLEAL